MSHKLNYQINLPENINDILNRDFWVFSGVNSLLIRNATRPIKFSSSTSVYIRRGECDTIIDLRRIKVKAPCIINICERQIVQCENISTDFEAACIVFSKEMRDALLMQLKGAYHAVNSCLVFSIPESHIQYYEELYTKLHSLQDSGIQWSNKAVLHMLASFFFSIAAKDIQHMPAIQSSGERLVNMFLNSVQQRFRTDHKLDIYANELGVTTRHLSRSVKRFTGFTAVEWIERYLILEAKVLLESTNMTIKQISDELGFATQSYFGKYFKASVGISPRKYRNSQ